MHAISLTESTEHCIIIKVINNNTIPTPAGNFAPRIPQHIPSGGGSTGHGKSSMGTRQSLPASLAGGAVPSDPGPDGPSV